MSEHNVPATQPRDVTRSKRDLYRAASSGWLATAMEHLDFQLYAIGTAIVFNKIFFPNVSPAIGLLAAMATFGSGYVARLVGAVYFGRMGDRIGRKKVLYMTVILMGSSTTLIGLLPTFDQVGLLAPTLLVALRLVQGFGTGAEIAGASVMLVEYAPKEKRGFYGTLSSLGTNSGTLLASGVWAILLAVVTENQLLAWAWRIPFLLSIILVVVGIWVRRNLKESPVFESRHQIIEEAGGEPLPSAPLTPAGQRPRSRGKAFALALGLRFGQCGNSGLAQTFMVGYVVAVLMADRTVPTNATVYGTMVGLAVSPLVGILSDRIGRRPIYIAVSVLCIVGAFPMMQMIASKNVVLITIGMILVRNIAVLGPFSIECVTMNELFGSRSRFTKVALSKELGSLVTAVSPALAAVLTELTHSWWPIAALLIGFAAVTLVAALFTPETRNRDIFAPEDAA